MTCYGGKREITIRFVNEKNKTRACNVINKLILRRNGEYAINFPMDHPWRTWQNVGCKCHAFAGARYLLTRPNLTKD
jgi:hypothetical protein